MQRRRDALTSPLRLELLGLFTTRDPLSISDMAERMGRSAGSLYHHVGILEEAGFLRRVGTRPKGKRFETLFAVDGGPAQVEADPADPDSIHAATRAVSAALRMTERDIEAALTNAEEVAHEGPHRNFLAARVHMRISPDVLQELNAHLDAIQSLLQNSDAEAQTMTPSDQLLSLTLVLAPLKGRNLQGD